MRTEMPAFFCIARLVSRSNTHRSGRCWPLIQRSRRLPFTASTKCWGEPAPPLATTGMRTAELTAAVIGMSYPSFVPSQSMLVSTISPALNFRLPSPRLLLKAPLASFHLGCGLPKSLFHLDRLAWVNIHNDALRAKSRSSLLDQLWIGTCR